MVRVTDQSLRVHTHTHTHTHTQVENRVVGAPCGVMDQMASTLGGAGRLLALLCQPAEVLGNVPIPNQVRVCVCACARVRARVCFRVLPFCVRLCTPPCACACLWGEGKIEGAKAEA